nr:hypothetical protein [Tanacetum cinerariifolium]
MTSPPNLLPRHIAAHKHFRHHPWPPNQGRPREAPRADLKSKTKKEEGLEAISRRTSHKTFIRPTLSSNEFAGELTLLKSISPGIDETDCDFEEDIRLIEKLLYDNSSPRPPKEFISANSDAAIKSFSPSPILVKDSDSLMEEINLF